MINKKLKKSVILDLFIKEKKWKEYCLIKKDDIEQLILFILNHLNIEKVLEKIECSIFLTDDKDIQNYNKRFRNKNYPTNTLSFPSENVTPTGKVKHLDGYIHLGDIIFSIETVSREAIEQRKNFYDHFYHLLLHSFLHLLGYEHEVEKDRLSMEEIEIKILSQLNITNPYV